MESILFILINFSRITAIKQDPVLTHIAQERANYLCTHEFSHDGWKKYDSDFEYRGENLAADFPDAFSAHKALMASPTHKANIVNPKYQYVGIASACGITVQEFGGYIKK